MPNTLAHLGAQALPWKVLDNRIDIKWLGLGCVIPDLPWIIQRIVPGFAANIDLIHLRIYCMILASLLFCLLLSGAIALLARNSAQVFLLLALNSSLHLLLDASQTKWANGVHLFAPLSWHLSQFHLFWPESSVTLVLSLLGFVAVVLYGWRDRARPVYLRLTTARTTCSVFLLLVYLLLPLFLFNGPLQADNHYVNTLRHLQRRSGEPVGFDRCRYDKKSGTIEIFTGERLKTEGALPAQSGTISLYGSFKDRHTVHITTFHEHDRWRDFYSYTGLTLLLLLWGNSFLHRRVRLERPGTVSSIRLF